MRNDRFYEATITALRKYGWRGITTKRVAAELNCSESLIYKYFESFDDLLFCTYKDAIGKAAACIDDACAEMNPADEKDQIFKQVWDAAAKLLIGMGNTMLYCVSYARSMKGYEADIVTALTEALKDKANIREFFVRCGIGYLGDGPKALSMMTFILANLSTAVKAVITEQVTDADVHISTTRDLVMRGLSSVSSIPPQSSAVPFVA